MVEGARLESVYTGNGIAGSNPVLSAIFAGPGTPGPAALLRRPVLAPPGPAAALGSLPVNDVPTYDDANFALRLYELRRESELRKARQMVGDVLDGASWEVVNAVRQYGHPQNAHFRQVTSYWEMVATFVARGIFHPDVYLDSCGEGLYTYSVLKPFVERIRASGSPRFLKQTESIVAAHPQLAERVAAIDAARAAYEAQAAAKPAAAKKPKTKAKAKARRA